MKTSLLSLLTTSLVATTLSLSCADAQTQTEAPTQTQVQKSAPMQSPIHFDKADVAALATANPNAARVTQRDGALDIAFANVAYPSIGFAAGQAYQSKDWSGVGALAFDVTNPDTKPLQISIRVDDQPADSGKLRSRGGGETLRAGERLTMLFPFSGNMVGMRAGPPMLTGEMTRTFKMWGDDLDLKNITSFQIFLSQPGAARELKLHSVRWLPQTDFRKIVDRYGQYTRADWPGKLKDEAEFATRIEEEYRWNRAHPAPANRDEFGGWKDGPQLKASGFFRTALVKDNQELPAPQPNTPIPDGARWWLVTPSGHLFWSVGIDLITYGAADPVAGRETMFEWLPDEWKKSGKSNFYGLNLQRKFGDDWATKWQQTSAQRLRSWGFNTVANWSNPAMFEAKIPYVISIRYAGVPFISADGYSDQPGATNKYLPDFFDPKFREQLEAIVVRDARPGDPYCIGYYVDNEMSWDTWAQGGEGGDYIVAREAIRARPNLPARREYIKQLRAKYGTVEAWSQAWGIEIKSWDEPVKLSVAQLGAASRADSSAFLTLAADKYFSTVQEVLRKHAPNQLSLGARFAIRPIEAVRASARYCDVVSFNIYADQITPADWGYTKTLGKPVIVGEFTFSAPDRGMFPSGSSLKANQTARGAAYANYISHAQAMPAFVGAHWFQYVDEPLVGRFDGENYGIGFVSVTDTPYPELREAARRANSNLYAPDAREPVKAGP